MDPVKLNGVVEVVEALTNFGNLIFEMLLRRLLNQILSSSKVAPKAHITAKM